MLAKYAKYLSVKMDTPRNYVLASRSASPFPQHKGQPLDFAYIRIGKAYVSFHLMALYLAPIPMSPALKKRMHGKTCFNFESVPAPALLDDLKRLTEAGFNQWRKNRWL
jgi:hypothetical protein